jgi:hypothetical protein
MAASEHYFCMSVVSAAIAIAAERSRFPGFTLDQLVSALKAGRSTYAGLDYTRALEMCTIVGWDAIALEGDRESQLRETVRTLALRLNPLWMQASQWGRERAAAVASDDQRQLLAATGVLAADLSAQAIGFWDALAVASRQEENARNVEIGRKGEKLTLEYEHAILSRYGIPKSPKWVALEDNTAGYDILSYRMDPKGAIQRRLIEVKACSFGPMQFFLSRSEWDCAEHSPDAFVLHVWSLETLQLREIAVSELRMHMPQDHGRGNWTRVRVAVEDAGRITVSENAAPSFGPDGSFLGPNRYG